MRLGASWNSCEMTPDLRRRDDSYRLSGEEGANVLDRIAIVHAIVFSRDVSQMRCEHNILEPPQGAIRN